MGLGCYMARSDSGRALERHGHIVTVVMTLPAVSEGASLTEMVRSIIAQRKSVSQARWPRPSSREFVCWFPLVDRQRDVFNVLTSLGLVEKAINLSHDIECEANAVHCSPGRLNSNGDTG